MGKRKEDFSVKMSAAESVTGVSSGADFSKPGTSSASAFGIHDRAGKLVGANFAAFFEDVDIFSGELGLGAAGVVLLDEIGEMQRAAQSGGPCADDQYIGFELFALDGSSGSVYQTACLMESVALAEASGIAAGEAAGRDERR